MVASAYGCKCHVVLPDDAAIEKVSVRIMDIALYPLLFFPLYHLSNQSGRDLVLTFVRLMNHSGSEFGGSRCHCGAGEACFHHT